MNNFFNVFILSLSLLVFFSFLPNNEILAQQVFGIQEDIGGGSGTNSGVGEADNTALYLVGGAVIVGIIVYAIVKNKKSKNVEEDSTNVKNESQAFVSSNEGMNISSSKSSPNIPIDLYFGMQSEKTFNLEKKYLLGVKYSF